MGLIDLSMFRANFIKDTEEEQKELVKKKSFNGIPQGSHEVILTEVTEKFGGKISLINKLGGCVEFTIIFRNVAKQEQFAFCAIPMHLTFGQAIKSKEERGTAFKIERTYKMFQTMGVDPRLLREAILLSDGEAISSIVGAQCVLVNHWDPKSIHIEYDNTSKGHYFVTAMGQRFESGEMSVPLKIDYKIPVAQRFVDIIAVAKENGFKFTPNMETVYETHPTATNDLIIKNLQKFVKPKEPKEIKIVNKTIPPFPVQVKKMVAPLDHIEQEIDL